MAKRMRKKSKIPSGENGFQKIKIQVRQSNDPKTAQKNLQWAMKKFKKIVDEADIIRDYREHEYYEKPSEKKKKEKRRLKQAAEKGWI